MSDPVHMGPDQLEPSDPRLNGLETCGTSRSLPFWYVEETMRDAEGHDLGVRREAWTTLSELAHDRGVSYNVLRHVAAGTPTGRKIRRGAYTSMKLHRINQPSWYDRKRAGEFRKPTGRPRGRPRKIPGTASSQNASE